MVGLELQGRALHLLPAHTCLQIICLVLVYHLVTPIAATDIAFADSGHWIFLLVFVYLIHSKISSKLERVQTKQLQI